ncbi:MAG: hypothetical protein OXG82_12100 [Gammaproteobacteria bacterium]|nr:hypothetical protein [Gammaproteobacteria bacterium]
MFCAQRRLRGEGFARHWHDLARLEEAGVAAKALADRDIAASVAAHKAAFFREKGASENGVDYSVAVAGGMRLTRRRGAVGVGGRLCADGAERVAAPPPPEPFDVLMGVCQAIEDRASSPD